MFFSTLKLLNIFKKKAILIIRKVLSSLGKKVIDKKKTNEVKIKKSQDIMTPEKVNGIGKKKIYVTYFILFLLDIILVIYSARKNIVNYVNVINEDVIIGKTRYLFLGRNYINLIITCFFYLYFCLINRFLLKQKYNKKFLWWLLVVLIAVNFILFFIFTKRVY